MFLKAPNFWHKKNLISCLLYPFSVIYLLGYFFSYYSKKSHKINKPIICIGNLVAGGAGKTPVAIALGKILKELNIDFAYLSIGYGRKVKKSILVDRKKHNSREVGDESLLLSEIATTFVAKDRFVGAKTIVEKLKKDLIIMDDGLQNNVLKKDLSILIIDGNYVFGNNFIIPAGPLREPIFIGIKKADLIVVIGEDKKQIIKDFCINKKVIKAKIKTINHKEFAKKSVVAFCGIGRPKKFFDSLVQNSIDVVDKISYSDHYQYKKRDIEQMIDLAKKKNSILITTKKDWVRLDKIYQEQINYLDIEIEFENDQYIREILSTRFC